MSTVFGVQPRSIGTAGSFSRLSAALSAELTPSAVAALIADEAVLLTGADSAQVTFTDADGAEGELALPLTAGGQREGTLRLKLPYPLSSGAWSSLEALCCVGALALSRARHARLGGGLSAVLERSNNAIYQLSEDLRIVSWNQSAERIYGYTAEEVRGMALADLLPQDRAGRGQELVRSLQARQQITRLETTHRNKSGRPVEVLLTAGPTFAINGTLSGYFVIAGDNTERRRLLARVALSDQLASLGRLAAGVAHEINNPLSCLIMSLEMLGRESAQSTVSDSLDAARRIAHIVADLKSLSRIDENRTARTELRHIVDNALKIVGGQIAHRATLTVEAEHSPDIQVNEPRMVQVAINLLVNALQAIPEGNPSKHQVRVVTRSDERGQAVLEVQDTGCGIPPEVMDRIFDPFFTTKPLGIGTGIGLSICHQIISDHGGEISVESTRGTGTVFRVTLPAASGPVRQSNRDAPPPPAKAPRSRANPGRRR
jgi:PAS domain S-box-containing protein